MLKNNRLAILVPLYLAAACLLGGCYTLFSHPNSEKDIASLGQHNEFSDCASCHTECVECDPWDPIFPRPVNPIIGGPVAGPGVTPVSGGRNSAERGDALPPNNKAIKDPVKPPTLQPGTPGTTPTVTPVKPEVKQEEKKKKAKEKRKEEDPKEEKREEPKKPPQEEL